MRARLLAFAAVLAPFKADDPAAPRAHVRATTGSVWQSWASASAHLGKDDFREFLRMILINVADVLEDDLTR